MAMPRIELETTALLAVDMQEKLLGIVEGGDSVVARAGLLIDGFNALTAPVLATEQYPQGLGATVEPIATRLGDAVERHEKLRFSACIEPILEPLRESGRRSVVICGIEMHVCVLQTALDLAEAGYVVAVAADACGSRRRVDYEAAAERMRQAGVIPTTAEAVLMEMVGAAGTGPFKAILPLIK
jgi:nicotinamidase-related amidase